ncbi:MAG: adenylyl-sulfate kinase [Nanobdellota archaeon]
MGLRFTRFKNRDRLESPMSGGFVLWFTGFSGAGKSTVAQGVYERLREMELKVENLDGDEVRTHLTKDLGFTRVDRETNISRVGFLASLLSRNGVGVVSAFISPYKESREKIRQQATNFIEIHVNAPLEICESRDVKGLYRRARAGEIQYFTGISDPYEAPETPELVLETHRESVDESVQRVMEYLKTHGHI